NIKYLNRISISKVDFQKKGSILVIITFTKNDLELSKSFVGDDLTIIREEINRFIEDEIKL
ncbi:MAG TPA: hypothetical protein PLS50_01675, partial [Candidatus Dojkabacteria bacterium]|nr:hypothetical protein [Candidatus Dojkabacteria bacterium]